jgi:hypothetical protein
MESSNGDFLTGSLDDVALWNGTVLTADQVSVLYSNSVRTVTFNGTDITHDFMSLSNPTANHTNSDFWTGNRNDPDNDTYRCLVKANLSSLSSTYTVKSAILSIMPNSDYSSNARVMSAYRVLRNWVGATSWNTYDGVNNWGTAGCANTTSDRESVVIGTLSLTASETLSVFKSIDLTASKVQEWINGTLTNNGILLQMATESDDAYRWNDQSTGADSPKLIIDYEPGVTTNYLKHYAGKRALE